MDLGTGAATEHLVTTLVGLVDAAAVTGDEAALATRLRGVLSDTGSTVVRVGDSLVVPPRGDGRPVVALVGHLDVVPPTDEDLPARVVDGADGPVVRGRGTSDMHGGNAVALALHAAARPEDPYDVALVLYAREEGPADANELADVIEAQPWLGEVDLAVVLEPTDGQVHLGCLGGVHATVTFRGRQAHSARPWHGRNALTAAGPFLTALDRLDPLPVDVDGTTYHDVWSLTQASTDSARNIVPGTFTLNLNLRFAPSRSTEEAVAELRTRVARFAEALDDVAVEVDVVDVAPPAPPRRDAALVQRLLELTGAEVAGKQAWTDVARFAALGVPAVNYGPGATAQAHQRGEHVAVAALVDVHERLGRFLATAPTG